MLTVSPGEHSTRQTKITAHYASSMWKFSYKLAVNMFTTCFKFKSYDTSNKRVCPWTVL